uniref:Tudor domain-containing protein n=1 Tax=Panagrellus redivivus TaxID=6233 RepID=A0A7E4V5G3_PANRE
MPVKVTETFENYVENVLDKEFMGYEVGRVEGVTPCERHFVIVTSKVAWYAVRVIIEPYTDDNDIYVKPYPKVTREGFFLQSQASEYVQETLYESFLRPENCSACRQFDQHVTEQLHRYCFDKEVHRLRGQDVDGKRFAYVLLENFSIVQITEASNDNQDRNVPELELMKYDSKFNAERFFHDGFHKRKQLEQYASQTYKSHTEVKVRTNYNSTDNDYVDIDFPNEYESINSLNQDESNP